MLLSFYREANPILSEVILDSVRDTILLYSFNFSHPEQQARIIDGREEGSFGWVTGNYLAGNFGKVGKT